MAGVTVDMFGADKRWLFMRKTVHHLKFSGGSVVVLRCFAASAEGPL